MSRTIELAESERDEVEAKSAEGTQGDLWRKVVQAMGYPESWGEELKMRLVKEGKAIRWTEMDGQKRR